ncbi:unnamed protein product [Leptidea sinapis]|uniref:Peptidase S1 domain-containing protein n=1 Tax=Leptidea sinapis TaxID=189913 RepID=A0A5E4QJD1_9NEOP|nr:unnamed protein product [Leptidea sinapis]
MWFRVVFLAFLAAQQAQGETLTAGYVEDVRLDDVTQSRIVSGWEANLGQHPHQAALRILNWQWQLIGCGASVIHQNWVLTAAHCTANYQYVMVYAGLVQQSNAEYFSTSWEWYNFPTFDSQNPNLVQTNDIALIRVTIPMTYTNALKRIQVQSTADAFREYTELQMYASGWGRTWTLGPTSEELRWVYLRGVSSWECGALFGSLATSATICARFYNVTSQSICQNDLGTPILVGVSSFVAGVNSGGCHSGHPGGFIRPGPFHWWFQQTTGINFESLSD